MLQEDNFVLWEVKEELLNGCDLFLWYDFGNLCRNWGRSRKSYRAGIRTGHLSNARQTSYRSATSPSSYTQCSPCDSNVFEAPMYLRVHRLINSSAMCNNWGNAWQSSSVRAPHLPSTLPYTCLIALPHSTLYNVCSRYKVHRTESILRRWSTN
jgi:hypothetical protein